MRGLDRFVDLASKPKIVGSIQAADADEAVQNRAIRIADCRVAQRLDLFQDQHPSCGGSKEDNWCSDKADRIQGMFLSLSDKPFHPINCDQ